MRYDANNEKWTPMEIKGIHGYFNDLRIDPKTVPKGFRFWELADGDCDGTPCRYIDSDEDWGFGGTNIDRVMLW